MGVRAGAVGYDLLREHLADLGDRGLAARSVARSRSAIRTYFGFLVEEGHLAEDPTEKLESPRVSRTLPDVLSYSEIEAILDTVGALAPEAYANGSRDAAMLETLYGAGLRISELIGLRLRDLSLDEGLVSVLGKGDNPYQYLDVEDLCDAIWLCATLPEEKANDVFNIGAGDYTTMKEDYQAVLTMRGTGRGSRASRLPR